MSALFHTMTVRNSKIARMMSKNFEEIGAALLDDPRLSVYSRIKLTTLLSLSMTELRMAAGLKDDASLFDVISFIVNEECSEIVGLQLHECTTKNSFLMTCDSDVFPTEDEILENSETESSVAKLQHLVHISERKSAVKTLQFYLKIIKEHFLWQMLNDPLNARVTWILKHSVCRIGSNAIYYV